jgi:hypothetical protein
MVQRCVRDRNVERWWHVHDRRRKLGMDEQSVPEHDAAAGTASCSDACPCARTVFGPLQRAHGLRQLHVCCELRLLQRSLRDGVLERWRHVHRRGGNVGVDG